VIIMENENNNIDEFLKKMGMRDDQQPKATKWDEIIQPNSSYLIVGDVGTGKSALAYYLLETFSQKYGLTPAVVGLPPDKRYLLPENFLALDSPNDCTAHEKIIVFIDEADLQLPIEDTKARQYVVNFLSLPRHRHQIFLLCFHFPRLVMGRYLPFFGAFLLKRPPYLIEFASKSKGDALHLMMEKAEERFTEFPTEDVVKHTYVVAPRIRWQGMLENPLCSFWTEELSEIWSGTDVKQETKKPKQEDLFKDIEGLLEAKRVVTRGWRADDPERKTDQSISHDMIRRGRWVEDVGGYIIMEAENEQGITMRWVKNPDG